MDRTVPGTGSEAVHLYMRTYYSLLRSTDMIQIETLVGSHTAMESSLHEYADALSLDVSALIYSALRLPSCIVDVTTIVLGQIEASFVQAGYTDVADWERVYAPGRRRRTHFNGDDTLAVYIISRSDIDDLVPILTAYQIEWNKLHRLLQHSEVQRLLETEETFDTESIGKLSECLNISDKDLQRLAVVWKDDFVGTLRRIASGRKQMGLRMISGSLADYRRATAYWWDELRQHMLNLEIDIEQHPVYFVSSNAHSIVNLLSGFAQRYEEEIVSHIETSDYKSLLDEYYDLQQGSQKSIENFLYYVLKDYLSETGGETKALKFEDEQRVGIYRIPSRHGFEIEAQIIDIGQLNARWFDRRIGETTDLVDLSQSRALIFNIDYPLGMAAYELLSRVSERVGRLQGVYTVGKAATLNGRIGDVMIPNVVHDEHSINTYLINNCFAARDVRPFMNHGNVLDNQKAVTVLGTYLQNSDYMEVFYHEGYTDIEMEGGPYLSAVYEAFRPKRHPINEIVNLQTVPFDIGILHYASDMPLKKGHNLGAGSLSYGGVEPTYATMIAVLRRIFQLELERLTKPATASVLR